MEIDVVEIVLRYACLLFSLCAHEAAHAAMADRCGDPSARLLGRATLNPLAHIDPMGTVVMPLLMMTTGIPYLIGWAKPVPVNPRNFNDMRRDQVLVSLAGPGANLGIALVSVFVLRIALQLSSVSGQAGLLASPILLVFFTLLTVNVALLVFNLLPIPPLDGSWVLHYFLPPSGQRMLEQIGPYGILLVMLAGRHIITMPLMLVYEFMLWLVFLGT